MNRASCNIHRRAYLKFAEVLESRTMMSADFDASPAPHTKASSVISEPYINNMISLRAGIPLVRTHAVQPQYGTTAPGSSSSGSSTSTTIPISQLPAYSSNPSAPQKLYLQFVGEPAQTWAYRQIPATPAYTLDADPKTFNAAELAAIQEIESRVAEKFSPFNLDVTTVNPGNLTDYKTMKVVIGGDGSWTGQNVGGISMTGSYRQSSYENVSWVFPTKLANSTSYIAEAAAHEAGHGFGLAHQASFNGTSLVNQYNQGNSLRAPVMGTSYYAARGTWYKGPTSTSSTSVQDDMLVLSSTAKLGYREDGVGHSLATATALSFGSSNTATMAGIIAQTSVSDNFSFTTTSAGSVNLTGSVAQVGAMLDMTLQLYRSDGTLVATQATSSLGESLTLNLPAGQYVAVVKSAGNYGDVGQYSLKVTRPASVVTQYPTAVASVQVSAKDTVFAAFPIVFG